MHANICFYVAECFFYIVDKYMESKIMTAGDTCLLGGESVYTKHIQCAKKFQRQCSKS